MLPYVLSKFFNLCMSVGYVPLSFGMSYTVPILKDKNTVHCKSIPVDDFRGISISPTISKVFEHCILDRYCQGYVPLTLDVVRVAFKVPSALHTPL